jgi:hypothetical protein
VDIEPLSRELIERYLDSRELRYYQGRGGRDFLVLFSTDQGRLHVNLGISGRDVLVVSATPANYYVAAERARLTQLVNDWNRDTHWPKAFVREVSQPNRIGVVGETAYPLANGIHDEALGNFIDRTIECAIQLFDKIAESMSLPSVQTMEQWLSSSG